MSSLGDDSQDARAGPTSLLGVGILVVLVSFVVALGSPRRLGRGRGSGSAPTSAAAAPSAGCSWGRRNWESWTCAWRGAGLIMGIEANGPMRQTHTVAALRQVCWVCWVERVCWVDPPVHVQRKVYSSRICCRPGPPFGNRASSGDAGVGGFVGPVQ